MDDGKSIHTRRWLPKGQPKALVLIAHGMAEHGGRYSRFAEALCAQGFGVWAPDHRGHGKTAAEHELGWLADSDGFMRVVSDLHVLASDMRASYTNAPFFLFGHSWGSFLAQAYMSAFGADLSGCILSGTARSSLTQLVPGSMLAAIGCACKGQKARAPLLDTMSFASFNAAFKPARTRFDWLSRDAAEVDAYCADPLCGFVCTYGFYRDMLSGLLRIRSKAAVDAIPKALPILIVAGSRDPVGKNGRAVAALKKHYERRGLTVRCNVYEGGRHELLNDVCRDEVMRACIEWLNERL